MNMISSISVGTLANSLLKDYQTACPTTYELNQYSCFTVSGVPYTQFELTELMDLEIHADHCFYDKESQTRMTNELFELRLNTVFNLDIIE